MADAENNNQPKDESEQFEKFAINEYETQFFGFTPKSFLDGGKGSYPWVGTLLSAFLRWFIEFFSIVYNAISDYVSECFGELEKQLASEVGSTK